MKITLLLDYPDDASPQFGAGLEIYGGKAETVQFSDLFQEHEALEARVAELEDQIQREGRMIAAQRRRCDHLQGQRDRYLVALETIADPGTADMTTYGTLLALRSHARNALNT